MNIYLLHIGYVVGVLSLSLIIGILTDGINSKFQDDVGIITIITSVSVAIILLLLSYY
jgi:hypothetical protein